MATHNKAVVAGGGPVGALAAIALARQGWHVQVRDMDCRARCFDREPAMPSANSPGKISTSTVIVSFAHVRRICSYMCICIRCLTNGRYQLASHQARTHELTCSTCLPEHNGHSNCLMSTSHPSLHPTEACWVRPLCHKPMHATEQTGLHLCATSLLTPVVLQPCLCT